MIKFLRKTITPIFLVLIIIAPYFIFSGDIAAATKAETSDKQTKPLERLSEVGLAGGYQPAGNDAGANNIFSLVGSLITIALSLVGIIFLILMIYGGFLWMTDRGSEANVKKAQKMIEAAIIGIIIVVSAYAITQFVNTYLIQNSTIIK